MTYNVFSGTLNPTQSTLVSCLTAYDFMRVLFCPSELTDNLLCVFLIHVYCVLISSRCAAYGTTFMICFICYCYQHFNCIIDNSLC